MSWHEKPSTMSWHSTIRDFLDSPLIAGAISVLMVIEYLSILSVTLLSLGILSLFEPIKGWRMALTQRPLAGLLYTLSFLATFLGSMSGGDIQSYIPDTVRYFRMLVLIIIFVVASTRILGRPSNAVHAGIPSLMMVFYAVLAMASASYSQAPLLSLWKGFEVLAIVLVPISLSDQLKDWEDIKWLMNLLSFVLLFFLLSVLAGMLIAPHEAFNTLSGGKWSSFTVEGVFPTINPNSVTQFGAFFVAFETIRLLSTEKYKTDSKKNVLPLVIGMTVMLLGHSRTSFFAAIFCLILVFFYLRRTWFLVSIPIAAALIAITKAYDLLKEYVLRGQDAHGFMSMSGRTNFWQNAWDYYLQNPFFGHGFYASHRVAFGTSGVDNAYLAVLLGVGIVGFVFFVLPVICTALTLFKHKVSETAAEPEQQKIWLQLTCIFGILFFRSLTGPSFDGLHHNLVIYAFLLIATSCFRHLRKKAPD